MKKEVNPRTWRRYVTHTLETLFYQREQRNRNHSFVHEHFGRYLTFVELPTFLKDRKRSLKALDQRLPDHVLVGFLAMKHYYEKGSLNELNAGLKSELRDLHRKLRRTPEQER